MNQSVHKVASAPFTCSPFSSSIHPLAKHMVKEEVGLLLTKQWLQRFAHTRYLDLAEKRSSQPGLGLQAYSLSREAEAGG